MFGVYNIPLSIEQDGISVSVEKVGESFLYKRDCLGEKTEKTLLSKKGEIIISPVEPLNKPKTLTTYLLINFEKSLMIGPKATEKVFLKFPIEIGVYISENEEFKALDVFTTTKQKFTVYGDPRNGVLCKHWKSDTYTTLPTINIVQEGVLELNLSNASAEWVELKKAVFNAYGMKIYHNDTLVSMRANMKIKGGNQAETDFEDSPLVNEMKYALERYTARKLVVTSTKFVMEFGL
jgi:hypothetical protein